MDADDPVNNTRCSDKDREAVRQLLDDAYADGRLDQAEHLERTRRVAEAVTFADLAPITADLTLASPVEIARRDVVSPVRIDPAGADPAPDRFNGLMSDVIREGTWRMRAKSTSLAVMTDVILDLREATFDASVCHIDVGLIMSDLVLIVPEGVTVVDQTTKALADWETINLPPTTGGPTVEVSGFLLMSDVKVCGPNSKQAARRDRKRLRRAQRNRRALE